MKAIVLLWRDEAETSHHIRAMLEREFDIKFMRYCGNKEVVNQDDLTSIGADYLFSFSPVIIRKPLLDSIKIAAINFHPAPPKYPGRGGCSYALFNEDAEYGVTAHLMTEKIDEGAILDVMCFPIFRGDTVDSLHKKALAHIPQLVKRWLEHRSLEPNGMQWSGTAKTQADFVRFMRIEDEAELARKVHACKHPTKPGPYIERNGFKFWYIEDRQ